MKREGVWLKFSWGGGGGGGGGGMDGDTFNPPSPCEKLLPLPTPCFEMFLERSLNDPNHHSSSILHCYPLLIDCAQVQFICCAVSRVISIHIKSYNWFRILRVNFLSYESFLCLNYELISCLMNWFPVLQIDFMSYKLIWCLMNWF